MDREEFEAWKEREYEKAHDFPEPDDPSPSSLQKFYPEWDFSGLYTTSLEPHTPLWVQLPFYDRINVGVNLRLDSREEFEETYSVSPQELLDLYEEGHINLRLLYPLSDIEPAEFYEPLVKADLPSSMRDWTFSEKLLGQTRFTRLEERFRNLTSYERFSSPLDQVGEDPDRAQQNMWAVYVQLKALGYDHQADYFESIVQKSEDRAWTWLEVCRQFLIGPVHYSFGGIHSVSPHNPVVGQKADQAETMPTEIGEVLVNKLDLIGQEWSPPANSVDEALSIYDDYERARDTLWELKAAVEAADPDDVEESRSKAADLIDQAIDSHKNMLLAIKILAATGIGAVGLAKPYAGFLATLGYSISETVTGDEVSGKVTQGLEKKVMPPHLVSVIGLAKDANRI